MNILDDWLLDMIIWEEVTDPYETKQKVQKPVDDSSGDSSEET